MTVIVYFADLGVGISDLMITVDGPGQWPYLPSTGDPSSTTMGLPFHPSRLVRKVAKLTVAGQSTPLMIAGTLSHIEYFVKIARELASGSRDVAPFLLSLHRNNTGSVLRAAARIAEFHGRTDLSVIGLRGKETIGVSPLCRHLNYFGNVWLAGSGALDMEVYLDERAEFYARAFPSDSAQMRAYRVMHYLPIQMLHADRAEASKTLAAGVGAFYEVLLNWRGKLEPDKMSWLRIILDCESDFHSGARIRGLWWHTYEEDDLVVVSAPSADLHVPLQTSALLPLQRFRVDRFPPYSQSAVKPPGSLVSYLRKIPQTKFFSFGMHPSGNRSLIALTMAARTNAAVQVRWSPEGLKLQLHNRHFPDLFTSLQRGETLVS